MNETAEERRIRINTYHRQRYQRLHPNFRKKRPNHSPITKEFILDNIVIDSTTNCWNWKRGKCKGYGRVWSGQRFIQAHVAACELWGKPIPDGMFGCHHCDNRLCCNPDHIFAGTQFDNMRDASLKGRVVIPNKKLSNDQAVQIRNDTRPGTVIAKEYGVSPAAICYLRKGKTYKRAL